MDLRSGAALATLAYLDWAYEGGDDFASLPAYFPERMRGGAHNWFDRLRQRVRVTNRRRLEGSARVELQERDTYAWGEDVPPAWRRMIVTGDPGLGKSWLLRFEERRLAGGRASLEARTTRLNRIVLPIRLKLSEIAKIADAKVREEERAGRVHAFLETLAIQRATEMLARERAALAIATSAAVRNIGRYQGLELPPPSFTEIVRAAIRDGRAVVLLDAWDEVRGDTPTLASYLRAFADGFTGRLVVTSRDAGYNPESPPLAEAVALQLLALDPPGVEAFAQRWFKDDDEGRAARLVGVLNADRGQLFELARNPLMLTLMCRLFESATEQERRTAGQSFRVPKHRVEVYARCLEGLVRDWKAWKAPGTTRPGAGYSSDVVALLSRVAATLFEEETPYDAERVTSVILGHLGALGAQHALHGRRAGEVLELFTEDGLLVPTSGRRDAFAWLHRTFAEYLTGVDLARPAMAMVAPTRPDTAAAARALADAIAPRLSSQREVVLLALGQVGLVHPGLPEGAGPAAVSGAIEALLDRASADRRDDTLALAGGAVAELGEDGVGAECHARVTNLVLERLRGARTPAPWTTWAREIAGRYVPGVTTDAQRRAAFGNVLARIGDPRFHYEYRWCLPDDVRCGFAASVEDDWLGFVQIPSGTLLMGEDDDDDDEQHPVPVGAFLMARWPVTVAQFRAFVKAYREAGTDLERGLSNHPVVNVSWFDAQQYCAWLGSQFASYAERLPAPLRRLVTKEGWRVGLPSVEEWDWAARGSTGRIYPWGNEPPDPDRANYDGNVGDTSAVGSFPRGATPGGVEELAGNVWEWTRSECLGGQVLRGWVYDPPNASYYSSPRWDRDRGLGFRVVVSPFVDPLIV